VNQPPLNPDALSRASDTISDRYDGNGYEGTANEIAEDAIRAYLAVAQPVVNSVEELDALPVGTVVIINGTMFQADDRDVYGTMWSRVRDIDACSSESLALPARVLYRPEANDAEG